MQLPAHWSRSLGTGWRSAPPLVGNGHSAVTRSPSELRSHPAGSGSDPVTPVLLFSQPPTRAAPATYAPPAGWPLPSLTASEQKEQVPTTTTKAYQLPPADGSRPLEGLRTSAEFRQFLLDTADDYDKVLGLPPEKGKALRDAVANGTVRVSPASSVEGLNYHNTRTYTPNAFGGYDTASSSTLKPVGKPKEAFDANRAMAMWYADYGSVYIEW